MRPRLLAGILPVAALLTAVSLLLPWSRSGQNDRSSIELVREAGVLELVSGSTRWLLVGAWYLVVLLVAAVVVATGWGRSRAAAIAGAPLGLAMIAAAAVIGGSPLPLRWGAVTGCVAGLTATARAAVILIQDTFLAQGRTA